MEVNIDGFGVWLADNMAFLPAALGAATSAYFRKTKTLTEGVIAAAAGIPFAIYGGPVLNKYLDIGHDFSIYLTGFFGLNLAAALLEPIRRFSADADLWTLVRELVMNIANRLGAGPASSKAESTKKVDGE